MHSSNVFINICKHLRIIFQQIRLQMYQQCIFEIHNTQSFTAIIRSTQRCGNTLCLKNVPPLTYYNLYIHGSIGTIFGTNVAEKIGNQNVLYFPTSPKQCFCTTWGNRKPGNCVFSLKCCMIFHQKTRNTVKNITWSELNRPPFTVKTIDWVHQTGPRKGAQHPAVCYPHVLCQSSLSQCQSLCERWELFFVKPGVKVNGEY